MPVKTKPIWSWDLATSPRRRHRLRAAIVLGPAPGSHGLGKALAVWWVRWGELRGVNLRLFHSFQRPCLTVLVHWR